MLMISIHTLLAKGDDNWDVSSLQSTISIHTLLAKGDAAELERYSRRQEISIHTLLAKGDSKYAHIFHIIPQKT